MKLSDNNIQLIGIIFLFVFFTQGCATTNKMEEENTREMISSNEAYTIPADSSYKVQSGDEIEILVWEQSNFNTTTTVSSSGTIGVPLIGEVQASGLTQDQLKRNLKEKLSQYIKEDVNLTLSITNTDNLQVSVFGMVSEPDNYTVVNKMSIFKILSMAGGPSEEANIRNVRIYRQGSNPKYTTLDLTSYLESGEMSTATEVYPGDVVYVPREENAIREMSAFLGDVVMLFGIFRIFR